MIRYYRQKIILFKVGNSLLLNNNDLIFFFFLISVSKFSKEIILPLVSKMDTESKVDESLLKKMFENGVSKH